MPPRLLIILVSTFVFTTATYSQKTNLLRIDHVPIVVKKLDSIAQLLADSFFFTIKKGRLHGGITNAFIKFQDGSYLEFTSPIDSNQPIGKFYAHALQEREGPTALAIAVQSANWQASALAAQKMAYTTDSNAIWKTIDPADKKLFFIEYANKQWKDSKSNTTHANTALGLSAVYLASNYIEKEKRQYQRHGFRLAGKGEFLNGAYTNMQVGTNRLLLLDQPNSEQFLLQKKLGNLNGICGFEIKVASLAKLNGLLNKKFNTDVSSKRTICFFRQYNFFLVFVE
jgi:Glyoxalase-like domain